MKRPMNSRSYAVGAVLAALTILPCAAQAPATERPKAGKVDIMPLSDLKPGMQVSVIAKGGIAYIVPVKTLDGLQKSIGSSLTEEQKLAARRSLRDKKDRKS